MPQFTEIADRLATLEIEVPSWAYGNSGTRFKVFAQAGTPRTVQEKIADAAQVQKASGLAPAVALHIPWDKVDDYDALNAFAADHGVRLGTVNSNTFQDEDFKLGSLCNPTASIPAKAVHHNLDCIDVMTATRSMALTMWLAEGTTYLAPVEIRGRQLGLAEGLAEIYAGLGPDERIVLEYKFFEP